MREQVLHYIRERKLLKAGDRVAVAVSGGADSVALLRVLLELRDELGIVLFVAHFNHQLRGEESDADERFVIDLTERTGVEAFLGSGDVREHGRRENLSTEAAARDLRYRWLTLMAAMQKQDCVATAHSLDDQAETVLMKFLRGAGTKGLAGIHPEIFRGAERKLRFIRPLLGTPRSEIERYLNELHQPWREDHSNSDTQHTRNRIRHELLPLLEREYNPNLRNALSETAEIARSEEDFWNQTIGDKVPESAASLRELDVSLFEQLHIAPQRRALKCFLEWNGLAADFDHIESLRRCALGETQQIELGGGWWATTSDGRLKLRPLGEHDESVPGYECSLTVPGEVLLPQIAGTIAAKLIDGASAAQADPGTLLRLGQFEVFTVRNWLPGDRFRPAHSGSEKKLKELFAERKIPAEQRKRWPVILNSDNQIIWVRDFPVAHEFAWAPGSGDAIRIEVLPLEAAQGTSSEAAPSK